MPALCTVHTAACNYPCR